MAKVGNGYLHFHSYGAQATRTSDSAPRSKMTLKRVQLMQRSEQSHRDGAYKKTKTKHVKQQGSH